MNGGPVDDEFKLGDEDTLRLRLGGKVGSADVMFEPTIVVVMEAVESDAFVDGDDDGEMIPLSPVTKVTAVLPRIEKPPVPPISVKLTLKLGPGLAEVLI